MRRIWLITALAGLILTLVVLAGRLSWDAHAQLMAVGMVLWFVGASFGMRRKRG
jgi:amino acid permease